MFLSDRQVLITGCYRSFTDYVTQLLNNHPELSASMDTVNFMRFSYDRYNPIVEEPNYSKLVFDATQRIRSRWRRNVNVHQILDRCSEADAVTYAQLYDLLMCDLFLGDASQGWAEKTQLVWTKIPAFLEMFPEGKVVHVVRDPRGVLASFKKVTYVPEPGYLGAIFNCYGSMKSGLEYKQSFGSDRYLLVKGEDFMTSPESAIVGMFNFLGLSTSHELLSEEGWKDPLGNPWRNNSAFLPDGTSMSRDDMRAATERWKESLSDQEIALCEAINGEFFDHFGYLRSDISEDWSEMVRPLLSDERLTGYLRRWITESQGVEEFPTDPLLRQNWPENVS